MRGVSKTIVMIQARSTSERLPGKIGMKIGDKSLLQHSIDTCREAHDNVVVLIPHEDPIKAWLQDYGVPYFEGSEDNVLNRYYQAARAYCKSPNDIICRVTSDCGPFTPVGVLFHMIHIAEERGIDFFTNAPCTCGFDIELFSFKCLDWVNKTAFTDSQKEHVTEFMLSHGVKMRQMGFVTGVYRMPYDIGLPKLSIDSLADLELARKRVKLMEEKQG